MIGCPLQSVAAERFDLIVIGGGIHGASILDEATARGLRCLLLEARDFGNGASSNSLRILHGGLRYLQTLDLARFRQSVNARAWFAKRFPHLVSVLPCAMPLYGRGAKRRAVMTVALKINDLFSIDRNRGLEPTWHIPDGDTLDRAQMAQLWPAVPQERLEGGAVWADYRMVSSERILIETLQHAARGGAVVCNHAPVTDIERDGQNVRGVRVRSPDGTERRFEARRVINATGGWAYGIARSTGTEAPRLFTPSLAFNALIARRVNCKHALAVAPQRTGSPVYFVIPQGDTTLAGTVHLPRPMGTVEAVVTQAEMDRFLSDLNEALPGFDADRSAVARIFCGLLPVRREQGVDLTKREVVLDHGAAGGLHGLYSVTGIKYTTSREVAVAAVDRAAGGRPASMGTTPDGAVSDPLLLDAAAFLGSSGTAVSRLVRHLRDEEGVRTADDVIWRRSNWSTTVADVSDLRRVIEDTKELAA